MFIPLTAKKTKKMPKKKETSDNELSVGYLE